MGELVVSLGIYLLAIARAGLVVSCARRIFHGLDERKCRTKRTQEGQQYRSPKRSTSDTV